jgi:hypothetical protein
MREHADVAHNAGTSLVEAIADFHCLYPNA